MSDRPCAVPGCTATVRWGSLCSWHRAHEEYQDSKPRPAPQTVSKRTRLENAIKAENRKIAEARAKRDAAQEELDKMDARAAA